MRSTRVRPRAAAAGAAGTGAAGTASAGTGTAVGVPAPAASPPPLGAGAALAARSGGSPPRSIHHAPAASSAAAAAAAATPPSQRRDGAEGTGPDQEESTVPVDATAGSVAERSLTEDSGAAVSGGAVHTAETAVGGVPEGGNGEAAPPSTSKGQPPALRCSSTT